MQCVVVFKNPVSFGAVKLMYRRAHIEKMEGLLEQTSVYCKKQGLYYEVGDEVAANKLCRKQ